MSAAMFRSNGKAIVNFMSVFVSKLAFCTQSRVGHILSEVTRSGEGDMPHPATITGGQVVWAGLARLR